MCNCQWRRLSCRHHQSHPTVTNRYSHSVGARHCGIPSNELADQHAKEAAAIKDDPPHPITLSNAVTAVKQLIRDTAPTHGRTKAAYDQYSERRDSAEISSRKDAIMLAQLRSSHSNLRAYRHVIDPLVDPTCPSAVKASIPWSTGSSNDLHWQLPGYTFLGPQMYL